MKKTLVVGFITDGKRVLLINKNRPENQKGLFNGDGVDYEWEEGESDIYLTWCIG